MALTIIKAWRNRTRCSPMGGGQLGYSKSPIVQAATTTTATLTYAQQVLADTPVAYWKFNEGSGTSITDYSGNTNTATTHNTPTMSNAGPMTGETCMTCVAASTQYADFLDANSLDFGNVFTLEAWVKRSSLGVTSHIFTKGANTPGFFYDNNVLRIGVHSVGDIGSGSITFADTTTWHHVVWTKNGATNLIYVDAVEGHGSLSDATASSNASGGWIAANSDLSNPMQGSIAHVAVYATALSAARISAHFAARA